MDRLTKKDKNGFLIIPNKQLIEQTGVLCRYCEKLCQLEDFEEELGIDLITLIEILKNKYVYTNGFNNRIEKFKFEQIEGIEETIFGRKYLRILFREVESENDDGEETYGVGWLPDFKDYGKTWSLTREELEK